MEVVEIIFMLFLEKIIVTIQVHENGMDSCVRINSSSNTLNRVSYNTLGREMRSDLERHNLFVFVNTELDNGIEAYSEIGIYNSEAAQVVFPGTTLGAGSCAKKGSCTQPMLVPLSNYWLKQLVDEDGNKLVDNSSLISNDLGLWKARHRFETILEAIIHTERLLDCYKVLEVHMIIGIGILQYYYPQLSQNKTILVVILWMGWMLL